MPEFELPSRTTVKVVYEVVDVSADIATYILSFEYTDKSSGESDEIQLTLEDREGKWLSSWFPSKGDTVTASIGISSQRVREIFNQRNYAIIKSMIYCIERGIKV